MNYFKNPLYIEKKINIKIKNIKFKKKNNFFCLPMFPYTSGKLHLGHVRNYTITNIISNYKNMCKYNTMHSFGWDAFGLPAENASKKYNINPEKWTLSNIKLMREQVKKLNFNFNKNSEFSTCDINFYKWEFWFSILFYKNNLLYKNNSYVYWDNVEKCVLSNEQVKNNLGWRSSSKIYKKKLFTWFLNIKKYTKRIFFNIKKTNWSVKVKKIQKQWIKINFFFFKKAFIFLKLKNYINIKKIKNKKNLFFFFKNNNKKIFNKKIFYYDKILKKKKKIILTNFFLKNKNIKQKKINILINQKKIFFLKLTNIKNWAIERNRKWGSPFFYKKKKNNLKLNEKTFDTFYQSSWYYLNFIKTKNIVTKNKLNWFPINIYVGGIEHVNLHLIYLRIINNFFYDLNILNKKEIILNLINQGFINNKVYFYIEKKKKIFCKKKNNSFYLGIEKMSKSKKNGINPIKIIEFLGSDILKLFLITKKPIHKDMFWCYNDIYSIKKFIIKINNLIKLNIKNNKEIFFLNEVFNIKKIHNIISNINKILYINNSIKQIEIILFYLYSIMPNLSKIFWFKIGNNFPIEKFNLNYIKKKNYNLYYKNIFLRKIYNLKLKEFYLKKNNKNKINKIYISMDEISILLN